MKVLSMAVWLFLLPLVMMSQNPDFTVFTSDGNPSTLESVVDGFGNVDVVFLGENHDDSVGHRIQFELFKLAVQKYYSKRKVALSLEMFERDVQNVVDEYLDNLITEKHFLSSSRPWGNYDTDYRPLFETARENKLPVIAANAPRRYVNMVSRLGRDSLNKLSPEAKMWLAPLPFGEASEAYAAKFNKLMGSMSDAAVPAAHNPILQSQTLWDATMAYSIAEYLNKSPKALVVHLNGSFHTENRIGTPDHLVKYKEGAKFLVVTIRYEDDYKTFDPAKHTGLGDFVILTDGSAPRSKR